ncbi:MAG: acetyl-CoA carboxylase biotin carboxyl carrier protein subunit [Sphingobacteriaceae bacterium]|nr:acetyl-CoA carboxylase biotin carboxyl carrier protein subunit [Sphingobacteriaceae bacterium]
MKQFLFTINGTRYQVDVQKEEGNSIQLEVNGSPYEVVLDQPTAKAKTPVLARQPIPMPANQIKLSDTQIKSPLPGTILEMLVKLGDVVQRDQKVCVMEAMKMENSILSEMAGKVKAIRVQAGAQVLQGDVLIELEA